DIDGNPGNEYVSEGMEMQQRGGEEERNSFMGTVQWEPTDIFSLKGDVFHTKSESYAFARGFRVKNLHADSGAYISNPVIVDGNMIGGTVTSAGEGSNFAVFTVNDDDSRVAEVLSLGLNAELRFDRLTFSADVSYSESDGDFQNFGTRALLYNDASASTPERSVESITYLNNGLNPADFSATQDYTSLNRMALTEMGSWPFITNNEIAAVKFDVQYELDAPVLSSIEAGIRYSEREYQGQRGQDGYGAEFGNAAGGQNPIQLTEAMTKVVGFGGDLAHFPDFLAVDFERAKDAVNARRAELGMNPFNPVANWGNNWTMIQSGSVNEDVLAGYIDVILETEVAGILMTGNIGVRVVELDQYITGYLQVGNGDGTPINDERGVTSNDYVVQTIGKKYTDYLPSLNLNFHLTD